MQNINLGHCQEDVFPGVQTLVTNFVCNQGACSEAARALESPLCSKLCLCGAHTKMFPNSGCKGLGFVGTKMFAYWSLPIGKVSKLLTTLVIKFS